MTTVRDIAWAAGFLEGEGSFGCHGGTPRVSAGQVQKEPLDRLQAMFGGHMWLRQPKGLGNKPVWIWSLNKERSAGAMMTLYTLMSPKRKAEIEKSLDAWKLSRRVRKAGSTVCLQGHIIAGDNALHLASRTYPTCRRCKNDIRNKWRKALRHESNV